MEAKFVYAPTFESVDALIGPDVRSGTAMSPEFDVVDVGSPTLEPNKDQLMLASVKRTHAGIRLAGEMMKRFKVGDRVSWNSEAGAGQQENRQGAHKGRRLREARTMPPKDRFQLNDLGRTEQARPEPAHPG